MSVDILHLWSALAFPMLRLLLGMCLGLAVASLIECLNWTRFLARLAYPLARVAHLQQGAAASFSLAFFSPASANALLAEAHDKGSMSSKELMLANLFNSLPAYIVHLPSIFFITWSALGTPALIYVGLTLLAAAGRTVFTIGLAHCILPEPAFTPFVEKGPEGGVCKNAIAKALTRVRRRLPRLVYFTVPVYVGMYFLQSSGFFGWMEGVLGAHVGWLGLKPQALGVIALHFAAELGAAISAAGAALVGGGMTEHEIVLALLIGNVLSTPMRAIRHQLPSYAGFYKPLLATRLVLANQAMRALSMILVALAYALW